MQTSSRPGADKDFFLKETPRRHKTDLGSALGNCFGVRFYLTHVVNTTRVINLWYQTGDALSNTSGPDYFCVAPRFNASLTYF